MKTLKNIKKYLITTFINFYSCVDDTLTKGKSKYVIQIILPFTMYVIWYAEMYTLGSEFRNSLFLDTFWGSTDYIYKYINIMCVLSIYNIFCFLIKDYDKKSRQEFIQSYKG